MRAALILGGLLVASSALAASEGDLEKFGATGLPQAEAVFKAPASQHAKVAVRVTKETPVSAESLEKFGATGLGQ